VPCKLPFSPKGVLCRSVHSPFCVDLTEFLPPALLAEYGVSLADARADALALQQQQSRSAEPVIPKMNLPASPLAPGQDPLGADLLRTQEIRTTRACFLVTVYK
jgi:hypothetical protein